MSGRRAVGVGQQLAPDAGSKSEEDGGPCILKEYIVRIFGTRTQPQRSGTGSRRHTGDRELKSPDEQLGKSGVLPVRHVDDLLRSGGGACV
jgi:hypothetical protein